MRPGLVVGCLVAGCGYTSPSVGPDGGAPGDAPANCINFSHQFDVCAAGTGGTLALDAGAYRFSTDDGTLTLNGSAIASPPSALVTGRAGPIRVILADALTLATGSSLRVDGGPAFGIAATSAVAIAGTIDATGGAGAQPSCGGTAAGNGGDNGGGGGGGGGGGFGAGGGGGGRGNSDGPNAPGGKAGAAAATPHGPIGGCPGGHGGTGEDAGGAGGAGGGAVYIVSAIRVTVAGGINAGGGAGAGGTSTGGGNGDAGGGGAGSGGVIVLEGPMVGVTGVLAANGGGGGQGSGNGSAGNPGSPGQLGAIAASGGSGGGSTGTNGGFGGVGSAPGGETITNIDVGGGGGGGGGVGFVLMDSPAPTTTGAVISPGVKTLPL